MTIYDTDYYTWTKEQAELLKLRRFEQVDWSNLIEEIEDLGNSRENALESYLERLLEHLLKLYYWKGEKERRAACGISNSTERRSTAFRGCTRGWKAEVTNFREQIKKILKKNPALKTKVEPIWTEIYVARIRVMNELFTIPSDHENILLSQALNDDWFPSEN